MKDKIALALLALGVVSILLSVTTSHVSADTRKCGGMKWGDTDHGDNNPSTSKFKQMAYHASLCDLSKCIDHSECANHISVDWNKFKSSPAYIDASDEQKDCLNAAYKDGNGMRGAGGYEIMDCGIGKSYKE